MRVSLINILIIVAALGLALVASLLFMRVLRWRRDVALRRHSMPLLVIPVSGTAASSPPPQRPVISRDDSPVRHSPSSVRRVSPSVAPEAIEEPDVVLIEEAQFTRRPTEPLRAIDTTLPPGAGRFVEGSHVRFYRAEEGTLEFLPGRLEIVGGEDVGQEIHFTRQVGEEDATITFGRSEGPALRHVQLLDPTVSRAHARLQFKGGHWHLTNLSQTNPVILNGSALPDHGAGITLEEGDRIEMGAVIFLFHAR